MKPFYEVIKTLTCRDIIPTSRAKVGSDELLATLERVANRAAQEMNRNPIVRPRPNEVGNDIEKRLKQALEPETAIENLDMKQNSGYPDIKCRIAATGEVVFIECKTFNPDTRDSTQRSFYLSDGPAVRKKVNCDAIHVAISYEMNRNGNIYRPLSYKIVDLYDLSCNLKKEWYSNNRCLYDNCRVLASKSL